MVGAVNAAAPVPEPAPDCTPGLLERGQARALARDSAGSGADGADGARGCSAASGQGSDDGPARILDRVSALRAEGLWRRRVVQLPPLFGGVVLAVCGATLAAHNQQGDSPYRTMGGLICLHVGLWCAILSLRPQDRRATALLLYAIAFVFVVVGCALAGAVWLLALVADVALGASPPISLQRLWHGCGVLELLLACAHAQRAATALLFPTRAVFEREEASVIVPLALLALGLGCSAFWPPLRTRVHEHLARIGEGVSAAAGIAELLGGLPPGKVLAHAKATFRAMPASALTLEHFTLPLVPPSAARVAEWRALAHTSGAQRFAPVRPWSGADEALDADSERGSRAGGSGVRAPGPAPRNYFGASSPVQLGAIDAFISHSWHDDPISKFAALQQWRREFVRMHGREPTVWLDRLPALPVYLAGCKSLLALHGPTYFQRLWCVLELHIFYQMGGSLDQIQFVRVDGGVHAALAASAVGGGPSASPPPGDETPSRNLFDVRRATATDPFDHARLLAVIEGNGQGIVAFNEWVRGLLHLAHMRDELSAQRRAAAAGGSVGTGSRGRTPLSVRRHPA